VLTDDEVTQVFKYARRLFYSMRLENTGASLDETISHAYYLAVIAEKTFDEGFGLRRMQYLTAVVRKRIRWICNMQSRFFRPLKATTRSTGSRKKHMVPTGTFLVGEASPFTDDDEGGFVVDPPAEGDDDDFEELVAWAEQQLTEMRWREVFRMKFAEGKTLREIAEHYAVSKAAIQTQIAKVIIPKLREAAKCWY
jgi:hypothetical protein